MSNPEPKTSFYFNPRSREGSDDAIITEKVNKAVFQSTLP